MKNENENEIKRAFAMEVIEKWEKDLETYPKDKLEARSVLRACIKEIQSLLPKEEETKTEEPHKCKYCEAMTTQPDDTCYAKPTESDEVKDIITTEMVLKAQQAVLANHRDALANPNYAIDFIQSLKQPTLEQKARKAYKVNNFRRVL